MSALTAGAVGVAAAVVGWVAGAPTLIVAGPLVGLIVASEQRRRSQTRARFASAAALPQAVDQLIHGLRAGQSLGQSCLGLRLGGDLLSPLTDGLNQRRTLTESTSALASSGDPSVRLLAATLGVLAENGGPAVPALQRLRHTLIGVVNGQRQADAEAAQALASAGLLVAAPALFGLLVAAIDPDVARFYLSDPLGAACVLGSTTLSWVGWRWIHRQLAIVGQVEL